MKIRFPRLPRIRLPHMQPRQRKIAPALPVAGILRVPRGIALALIATLVAAASLVSFAESYRGLYLWACEHGLRGIWAAIWPLQVDVFIAVGELALFVALVDRWATRSRTAAWLVTLAGLAASVVGNVGHVTGHSLTVRATAAVPPLAAASALAVGLGVLKRVVEAHHQNAGEVRRAFPAEPGSAFEGDLAEFPPAFPGDPGGAVEVTPAGAPQVTPETVPGPPSHPALKAVPSVLRERSPRRSPEPAGNGKQPGPATPERVREFYAAGLAAGQVPSIRQIKREWPVGYATASELHDDLEAAVSDS